MIGIHEKQFIFLNTTQIKSNIRIVEIRLLSNVHFLSFDMLKVPVKKIVKIWDITFQPKNKDEQKYGTLSFNLKTKMSKNIT